MGVSSSSKSRRTAQRKGKRRENPLKGKRVNKNWQLRKVGFGSVVRQPVRVELLKARGKNIIGKNIMKVSKIALSVARKSVKTAGGKKKIRTPRVIPIPKTGGILPLVLIFAGLSVLKLLASGATGTLRAEKAVKKKQRG